MSTAPVDHLQKQLVQPGVVRKLGMEGGGQHIALGDGYSLSIFQGCQYPYFFANAVDDWCTDEHPAERRAL